MLPGSSSTLSAYLSVFASVPAPHYSYATGPASSISLPALHPVGNWNTTTPWLGPTASVPHWSSAAPYPSSSAKPQDVVVTVMTTSYVTTCPVTETVTIGGRPRVHTGVTTSTVYTTYTSTICTRCVTPPTPTATAPAPAKTSDVITTVIIYTSFTTCPVTKTLAVGHSGSLQVTQTVSTIYQTVTSTICTKCVAPPTLAPTRAGPLHESVTTVVVYATTTTCPITKTITSGTSTSLEVTQTVSTIYKTITSTICTQCYGPSSHVPAPGVSHSPAVAGTTPVVTPPAETNHVAPASVGNTPAGAGLIPSAPGSPTSHGIVTMTIVPVPEGEAMPPADESVPSLKSVGPAHTPVSNAPFPMVNGTYPNLATATSPIHATGAVPTASVASTGAVGGPTPDVFTGAASKLRAGALGGFVLVVMAALMR